MKKNYLNHNYICDRIRNFTTHDDTWLHNSLVNGLCLWCEQLIVVVVVVFFKEWVA